MCIDGLAAYILGCRGQIFIYLLSKKYVSMVERLLSMELDSVD